MIAVGCGKSTEPQSAAGKEVASDVKPAPTGPPSSARVAEKKAASDPKPAPAPALATGEAASDLKLFGAGYQIFLDINSHPPRSLDDLKTVIASDRPIEFSRYHIIWGVDLKPSTPARTVLAYEVDAPKKGGMVLFKDGKVEHVSAEEFRKLPQTAAAKPLAERTADVTFTPTEYYAEFEKLGMRIGQQYQGKVIELKGVVKGIGTLSGKPELLVVSPGNEQADVRCWMSGEEEFWAKVSKGQQVTVKGLVRDPQASPMLIECEITGTGPSMAVTITAEELAKEVASDGDKATAKYKGKSLILTGEVISAEPRGSLKLVTLKGTTDEPVECFFYSDSSIKAWDKKLVPGVKLKMYAEYDTGIRLEHCELISD
jgi:hypothetical protein